MANLPTADDIRDLSAVLLQTRKAAVRLIDTVFSQPTTPQAPAAARMRHRLNQQRGWGNAPAVQAAHADIHTAILAALDYLTAYRALLHAPVTVALAATSRAGLEAFARARWLLVSSSTEELLERQIALTIKDLQYIAIPNDPRPLEDQHGDPIDANALLKRIGELRDAWGLHEVRAPSVTALTAALLDTLPGPSGRQEYSWLSSIAHGEGLAINAFLTLERLANNPMTLRMDRNTLIEYGMYLAIATERVMWMIVEYFEPADADRERWLGQWTQASVRLSGLMDSRRPTST